jgi:hypothetical protein
MFAQAEVRIRGADGVVSSDLDLISLSLILLAKKATFFDFSLSKNLERKLRRG